MPTLRLANGATVEGDPRCKACRCGACPGFFEACLCRASQLVRLRLAAPPEDWSESGKVCLFLRRDGPRALPWGVGLTILRTRAAMDLSDDLADWLSGSEPMPRVVPA